VPKQVFDGTDEEQTARSNPCSGLLGTEPQNKTIKQQNHSKDLATPQHFTVIAYWWNSISDPGAG